MGKLLSKLVLLPCSKLYGMGTYIRNKLFDWKIIEAHTFEVPVICVGNIAAGGTGKTPHVEYLVEHLSAHHRIAVLSRGYRRNTKGFIIAGRTSTPRDIGDEAYQMFQKYGSHARIVVCEDRAFAIHELMRLDPSLDLIILDDAFQHRYVKPLISIVVSEYNRPIYRDSLLPYGHLRESKRGIYRADMLIVSKCPAGMQPWDYRQVINDYELFPYQRLFFSHFDYRPLEPVFPDVAVEVPYLDWLDSGDSILAIAGIGNPRPFIRKIKSYEAKVKVDIFDDHHNYTRKDIDYIRERFDSLKGKRRIIVTTEKDAVRLANNPYYPYELKASTFYLPIRVEFNRHDDSPPIIEVIEKELRQAGYTGSRQSGTTKKP